MNIVISYPCSGRTFLTLLLQALKVPTTFTHYGLSTIKPLDTLTYLEKYPNKFSSHNLIILQREARDVVVSYYFNQKYRTKRIDAKMTLSEFIRNDSYGVKNIMAFNSFASNFNNCYLLKFEKLISNTEDTLVDLLKYISVDSNDIHDVVNKWTFDFCRKYEKQNTVASIEAASLDFNNPEVFKFRRGKIGNYSEYMSDDDLNYCNKAENEINEKQYKL